MKKLLIALLLTLIFSPSIKAEVNTNIEDTSKSEIVVSETIKYYKTIYYNNASTLQVNSLNNNSAETIEISKEEYDNANPNELIPNLVGIETAYKKLTSQIIQNGAFYRYRAELTWKNIPSKRSYDIMGIGFNSSVSPIGTPVFQMTYCKTNGYCNTSSTHTPQTFTNGLGTSFKLPSDDLTSLSSVLYFNVTKNSNTVTSQFAAADYSHATSDISKNNAKNYYVSGSGIVLNGITSYYDNMSSATSYWNGTW